MPPRLKSLSGSELIKAFAKQGFFVTSRRGSHVKLKRIAAHETQILVIPNHKSISKGTLQSIYRKARSYLPEEVLRPLFYTET